MKNVDPTTRPAAPTTGAYWTAGKKALVAAALASALAALVATTLGTSSSQ